MSGEVQAGCLYLVGTPIGNLEDISYRAVRVLGAVQLIAAEDTRKARVLLEHYGIAVPTISLFEANEARRAGEIVAALREGRAVAVISEAGNPAISDPGWQVLRRCLDEGLPVDVIPGPSAVLTALVLSGLPAARFRFLGFMPRKGPRRRELIATLQEAQETAVIFESPARVAATIAELAAALGDREAALLRELTKLHQEAVREPLSALAQRYAQQAPRGEVCLVIAGAPAGEERLDDEALAALITARLRDGERPREIAAALASRAGRRRAYQLALQLDEGRADE